MSKAYARFITVLFAAVLALFCIGLFLVPKREFSEVENRYLQQFPKLNVDTVTSGKFMSQFETFITDQFPGRDRWVGAKAAMEQWSGKQENNGVYYCAQDTLIARMEEPDPERLAANLGHVQTLTEKTGVPVWFSLIPGAGHVWADRLPEGAPGADQAALLRQAEQAAPGAAWVDLETVLMAHREEDIFYRTDHHWTSLGARYAYEALAEAMGLTVPEGDWLESPQVVSTAFYGTAWSTSGAHWVKPDVITRYAPDGGITVVAYPSAEPEPGALYHPEALEKKDKYTYFMGGNKPLYVIRNENLPDGPKVLMVRDSYSDSLAPFLAQSCGEVHLFDVRYNLNSVAEYAEENGIDKILVLFSTANFATEHNLFVLSR